jgi:zinc transport system substrate-binding protein
MIRGVLRSATVCFISAAILILAACGYRGGIGQDNSSKTDGHPELNVVTSFYPVYIAAINVTRDIPSVTVKNMTAPQTGCLHDYALKPEDLKTLEKADVFIINGAGMESFLDDVIKQQGDLKIIEASKDIPLLEDDSGEENPHVWVSITNGIAYVRNIAEQLSAIDKSNADLYRANAEAYVLKLEALRDEMHDALDPLGNKDIVTFHEAFPYFAQEFDLNIAAVIEREPGSDPTPKELEEIIDTIKNTGIKALFAEPQYSSRAAEMIARETGAKIYTLDPVVTGESNADAYDAYIEAMQTNMEALLEALN